VILFVLIRAIALSVAVAIAFGLHLPNADWMPVATLVAMKPSLERTLTAGSGGILRHLAFTKCGGRHIRRRGSEQPTLARRHPPTTHFPHSHRGGLGFKFGWPDIS